MALQSAPLVWWPLLGVVGGTLLVCLYAFVIGLFVVKHMGKHLIGGVLEEEALDPSGEVVDRVNPLELPNGELLFHEMLLAKNHPYEDSVDSEVMKEAVKRKSVKPLSAEDIQMVVADAKGKKEKEKEKEKEEEEVEEKKEPETIVNTEAEDKAGERKKSDETKETAVVPDSKKNSSVASDGLGQSVEQTDVVFLSNPRVIPLNVNNLRPSDPFPKMYRLPAIPGVFPQGAPQPPSKPPFTDGTYRMNPSYYQAGPTAGRQMAPQFQATNQPPANEASRFSSRSAMDGGGTVYKALPKYNDM